MFLQAKNTTLKVFADSEIVLLIDLTVLPKGPNHMTTLLRRKTLLSMTFSKPRSSTPSDPTNKIGFVQVRIVTKITLKQRKTMFYWIAPLHEQSKLGLAKTLFIKIQLNSIFAKTRSS